MKRFVLVLVSVLVSGIAFAQPMHGHGMYRLGLTEAQRDQMFKIHHEQAPALHEARKALRQAHEELHKAAAAAPFDAARVRQLAEAEGKAVADMAFLRAQTMSRVREVLTPEQRSKLDERHRGPRSPRRG